MAVQKNFGGVPQAFGAGPSGTITGGTPTVPQGRLVEGLAPWLTQAQGTTQMSTSPATPSATSSTPWYQDRMAANQAADAQQVATQRADIAQQKALAEQIRAQKQAEQEQALWESGQNAYYDEQSGSWLTRPRGTTTERGGDE